MVRKRDGKLVRYDGSKIRVAIGKAFQELGQEPDVEVITSICEEISSVADKGDISVEEIQDAVEDMLMASAHRDVARAYVRYRYKRMMARECKEDFFSVIKEKIEASDVQNQNANVDELSFGGRMGEVDSEVLRQYALNFLLSSKSKNNHLNNRIYIHDLSHYPLGDHNCLSIPFDDLLANGFNTRQTDVRPAASVSTALQLVAVIFQLQSLNEFGGCAATHLDWTLVPYVRKSFVKHWRDGYRYIAGMKDELDWKYLESFSIESKHFSEDFPAVYQYAMDKTEQELKQAVEGLYHNLNTLQSRSGNQLPFTSINYGTCTLPEGRMVIKALLEGCIEGVGKVHRTSVFPCGIFQCMKGVNRAPGDPNYDLFRLALSCTAQRLYPNYANCDWSVNAGYDKSDPKQYVATMGCRTYNGYDINGLGFQKDGRGNICPVTIILPTLAMEAKEQMEKEYAADIKYNPFGVTKEHYIDAFMKTLDEAIDDAKDMLLERYKYICSRSANCAKFMYENNVIAGYIPEEGIESALKHGTLAVGQLGLAETLQILIGENQIQSEGMELAKQIEQLFYNKCKHYKEEYHLNFGVYYTPAENLCYTAMKKFQAKYGKIKNVSEHDFFTNSIHIPVWEKVGVFEKIDIESQLTGYSSSGCITYCELEGAVKNNIDALEQIVNYAMDKDIPYFAVNVPNDTCLDCGYTGEFNDECPQCGSHNIQQLRRVTGYLTSNYKTAFNKGKQQEVELRAKHERRCFVK